MKNKETNILYLHGLQVDPNEEPISAEKRTILEHYGTVYAPKLDYANNPNCFALLENEFKVKNIDLIVGSSMGGFMAYYLSLNWQKPCLAFNPALPGQKVHQNLLENVPSKRTEYLQVVLGAQDDVINAGYNLIYLAQNTEKDDNISIHIQNGLQHRIPVEVLEEEMKYFALKLKLS